MNLPSFSEHIKAMTYFRLQHEKRRVKFEGYLQHQTRTRWELQVWSIADIRTGRRRGRSQWTEQETGTYGEIGNQILGGEAQTRCKVK